MALRLILLTFWEQINGTKTFGFFLSDFLCIEKT